MNLTGIILNTSGCMDKSLFIKLKGKQNESMVRQVKIVFASVGY